ncbi:MAG: FecR domain-containing protein [Polyangiales bacterium]
MKHDDELPIEPLSDAAWKRVEHGVFAQLGAAGGVRPVAARGRRTPRRWGWVAVCAVGALAAGVLLSVVPRRDVDAHVVHATAAEPREVALDRFRARLAPHAVLRDASSAAPGDTWVVEHGTVDFWVQPRAANDPLSVLAGEARVEVVGTAFRVSRLGVSAAVEVWEGTVRISRASAVWLVRGGQCWPAADGGTGTGSSCVEAPEHAQPEAAQPSAVEPPDEPPDEAQQRAQFEAAAGSEARDYQHALQLYAALAGGTGPWAGNALFAQARLELAHHRTRDAERHLRDYLTRFPTGTNAPDVQALLTGFPVADERRPR